MLFANTAKNLYASAMARSLYSLQNGILHNLLVPEPGAWDTEGLNTFRRKVVTSVLQQANDAGLNLKMTLDEFVASSPPHVKSAYKHEAQLLREYGADPSDALLMVFLKYEKKLFKETSVGRLVFPRTKRFNCAVGVFLRRLEKYMFKAINLVFKEWCNSDLDVVFKGMNADQRGQLMHKKFMRYGRFFGLDIEKFDQNLHVKGLQFEHSCYTSCYRGHEKRQLKKLLKWQIKNKCIGISSDGFKVRWTKNGGRCSGDINTSLGNVTVVAAICFDYVYTKDFHEFEYINDGDDCGFMTLEDELFNDIQPFFRTKGFTLKKEPTVDIIERCVFCQSTPVLCSTGEYRMLREVKTSMIKDACFLTKPKTQLEWDTLRTCIALGGKVLTSGFPVQPNFYNVFMSGSPTVSEKMKRKFSNHIENTGFGRLSKGMKVYKGDITPESRYSYYLATGIDPPAQLLIEQQLATMEFPTFDSLGPLENKDEPFVEFLEIFV